MHVSLIDVAQTALQIYTHTERKITLCVTITVRRICKIDMLWVDIFNTPTQPIIIFLNLSTFRRPKFLVSISASICSVDIYCGTIISFSVSCLT